jgi:DNA-binding response OmpR family regulator
MKKLNILIVEDEALAILYLKGILKSIEYIAINDVFVSTKADEALEYVKNNKIDVVFMDINIEGGLNGIECATQIGHSSDIPIIYTTAFKDSDTIRKTNRTNSIAYLIKPFKPENVEASLNIALRLYKHKKQNDPICITVENLKYNRENKTLYENNKAVKLTQKELALVDLFFNNINQNISYETLKNKVWDDDEISENTIRDLIYRVKQKIPSLKISSVSKIGYILTNT